eukprot:gene9200-11275_t
MNTSDDSGGQQQQQQQRQLSRFQQNQKSKGKDKDKDRPDKDRDRDRDSDRVDRDRSDRDRDRDRDRRDRRDKERKSKVSKDESNITKVLTKNPEIIQKKKSSGNDESSPNTTPQKGSSSLDIYRESPSKVLSPSSTTTTTTTTTPTKNLQEQLQQLKLDKSEQSSTKFLTKAQKLNLEEITQLLKTDDNFMVISAIGGQSSGKSTILSSLVNPACNTINNEQQQQQQQTNSLLPFEVQTDLNFCMASHQTVGIDFYVTPDRLIFLDTQPLQSISIVCDMIEKNQPIPSNYTSYEHYHQVQSLKILIFLLSISNVVLVIQENKSIDMSITRLLRSSLMLKNRIPDISNPVHPVTDIDSSDFIAKQYFLIPEISLNPNNTSSTATKTTIISFRESIENLRKHILLLKSTTRFTRSITEREWLDNSSKVWDFIQDYDFLENGTSEFDWFDHCELQLSIKDNVRNETDISEMGATVSPVIGSIISPLKRQITPPSALLVYQVQLMSLGIGEHTLNITFSTLDKLFVSDPYTLTPQCILFPQLTEDNIEFQPSYGSTPNLYSNSLFSFIYFRDLTKIGPAQFKVTADPSYFQCALQRNDFSNISYLLTCFTSNLTLPMAEPVSNYVKVTIIAFKGNTLTKEFHGGFFDNYRATNNIQISNIRNYPSTSYILKTDTSAGFLNWRSFLTMEVNNPNTFIEQTNEKGVVSRNTFFYPVYGNRDNCTFVGTYTLDSLPKQPSVSRPIISFNNDNTIQTFPNNFSIDQELINVNVSVTVLTREFIRDNSLVNDNLQLKFQIQKTNDDFKSLDIITLEKPVSREIKIDYPYSISDGNLKNYTVSVNIYYPPILNTTMYFYLNYGITIVRSDIIDSKPPYIISEDDFSGFSHGKFGTILGPHIIFTYRDLVSGTLKDGYYEKLVSFQDLLKDPEFLKTSVTVTLNDFSGKITKIEGPNEILDANFNTIPQISSLGIFPITINNITKFSFEKVSVNVTSESVWNRLTIAHFAPQNSIVAPTLTPYFGPTDNVTGLPKEYIGVWDPVKNEFNIDFEIPARTFTGQYQYTILIHGTSFNYAQLSDRFPGSTVEVYSIFADQMPPMITNIERLQSNPVNVENDSVTIGWRIKIDDPYNGLKYAMINVSSDYDYLDYSFTLKPKEGNFVDGNMHTGYYDIKIQIPSVCRSQTFSLASALTMDNAHNMASNYIGNLINPFSMILELLDASKIQINCKNTSPNTISLGDWLLSKTSIKVDEQLPLRSFQVKFSVTSQSPLSLSRHIPIIYLDAMQADQLSYPASLVRSEDNGKKANYQVNIIVPYGFGGNNGFFLSLYGLADECLNFKGYSAKQLRDSGRTPNILSEFSGKPIIDYASEINAGDFLLDIYGHSFGTNKFVAFVNCLVNGQIITLDEKNIVYFSGVVLTVSLTFQTENVDSFSLFISIAGNNTNTITIVPRKSTPSPTPTSTPSPTPTQPPTEPPTQSPTPSSTPSSTPSPTPSPTTSPSPCPGSPECGGTSQGKCLREISKCECIDPWFGFDCQSRIVITNPPKVNDSKPNVELELPNGPKTTFSSLVSVHGIRELDANWNLVREFELKNWTFHENSTSNTYTYITSILHRELVSLLIISKLLSFLILIFHCWLIQEMPKIKNHQDVKNPE